MKLLKSVILFTSCLFFLSACYPTGEQLPSTGDDNSISEQIGAIASGNEHLEIDALPSEYKTELPKINVKVMEWDSDKINEAFLSQKPGLEHNEYPCDFFSNENYHVYKEEDKYWLVYEPGRLDSEYRKSVYGYGTMQAAMESYRFEDLFTEDSINSLEKDKAVNECIELLNKVGITNYSEPRIYAITADKANEYWKWMDYDEYEEWTVDNEIYFVWFPIEYNGIPVTDYYSRNIAIGGQGGYFVGSHISFVVTKEKVFSMMSSNIFSPEYELGENVKIKCSADNALKFAAEYYDGIVLGDQDIKINDCELVYVPYEQHDEKNFTLVPMWKINISVYSDSSVLMGVRDVLFIDAQTGNIIIW